MPKRVHIGTKNNPLIAGDDLELRVTVVDREEIPISLDPSSFVRASFTIYDMNRKILEVTTESGGVYPNFEQEEVVITVPADKTVNLYGTYDFEVKIETLDLGVITPLFGRITFEKCPRSSY